MASINDVFYVSKLQTHVRDEDQAAIVDVLDLDIRANLSILVDPKRFMDFKEKHVRGRTIRTLKV